MKFGIRPLEPAAPLDPQAALEIVCGEHDPSLDEYLPLRPVQFVDHTFDIVELVPGPGGDEHIGPLIKRDLAPFGKEILCLGHDFRSGCVIDLNELRMQGSQILHGLLRLQGGAPGLLDVGLFLLELALGSDSHDVAAQNHTQIFLQQYEIQGLVPGHALELQRNLAGYVIVKDQVVPAHFGNEPQHMLDIGILQIDGDRLASVLGAHPGEQGIELLEFVRVLPHCPLHRCRRIVLSIPVGIFSYLSTRIAQKLQDQFTVGALDVHRPSGSHGHEQFSAAIDILQERTFDAQVEFVQAVKLGIGLRNLQIRKDDLGMALFGRPRKILDGAVSFYPDIKPALVILGKIDPFQSDFFFGWGCLFHFFRSCGRHKKDSQHLGLRSGQEELNLLLRRDYKLLHIADHRSADHVDVGDDAFWLHACRINCRHRWRKV